MFRDPGVSVWDYIKYTDLCISDVFNVVYCQVPSISINILQNNIITLVSTLITWGLLTPILSVLFMYVINIKLAYLSNKRKHWDCHSNWDVLSVQTRHSLKQVTDLTARSLLWIQPYHVCIDHRMSSENKSLYASLKCISGIQWNYL